MKERLVMKDYGLMAAQCINSKSKNIKRSHITNSSELLPYKLEDKHIQMIRFIGYKFKKKFLHFHVKAKNYL